MKSRKRVQSPTPTLRELIKRAERAAAKFSGIVTDGVENGVTSGAVGFGFLMAEAELGLTFAAIALGSSRDHTTARRNAANARTAYDSVLKFRQHVQMGFHESAALEARVAHLRAHLQNLGETI